MSSPETQYVYIPNLVGRQMLRIKLDEVEAEGHISVTTTPTQPPSSSSSSPTYSRESSPSPSEESIESDE
ncbi:hypothetical protein ACN47E_009971 [Coniothyrium glycines]